MKKHYVLKNRLRFFSFIIVLTIMLSCIILASNSYAYNQKEYSTISVQSGDTLWDIAKKYNKSGDIRKYIMEIKKINDLSNDCIIYEGEELRVPA